MLQPNGTTLSGSEGISSYWQGVLDAGITYASLKSEELDVLDDTAIEVGSYTMKRGEDIADVGKYIVIWKKVEGHWKYHRDIWNSDRPA